MDGTIRKLVAGLVLISASGAWPGGDSAERRASAGPLIDPSKVKVRQVWADPQTNLLGAPSPDGRYLSFVDWATGDLAVHDLITGQNHRLTNKGSWRDSAEYAYFSVFSPDSRQIAYAWFNDDKFYEMRVIGLEDTRPPLLYPGADIGLTPPLDSAEGPTAPGQPYFRREALWPGLRGTKPRVVLRSDEIQFIKPTFWSQDGKYVLALVFGRNILNQIVLISVADGSVRVLKSPFWIYPKMMGMSRDGRWIVYSLNQDPPHLQHDIYLLSADGKQDIPLVEHPANDVFPVWAPDDTNILFTSNRTGTLDAWLIQVADGKALGSPSLVKQDVGRFLPLGFTRKAAFYYGLRTGNEDAYLASLDPETGAVLEPAKPVSAVLKGVNCSPDWSPDGKKLAFLSRVDTETHGVEMRVITIQSAETGEERQFGVPKLGYLDWLRWSPDGRAFLVGGADSDNNFGGLYRVEADDGRMSVIVQGEYAPPQGFEGVWSPDGKAVYYIHADMREPVTGIRFRNLKSGEERTLHRTTGFHRHNNLALSPDGRLLAFGLSEGHRTQAKVLMVMPAAGGNPRELLKLKKGSLSGVAWTRDGKHLLFSKTESDRSELCRVSAAGGRAQVLGLETNEGARISVHPDGRRIAYTGGKTNQEVWVMEDFLPRPWGSR